MPVRITVKSDHMGRILAAAKGEASRIVRETALAIELTVKDGMTQTHSGRLYNIGNVVHQASAAGEMPAVDTGALLNSITVDTSVGSTSAVVYTSMEYAPHLEFGTIHMQARPFLAPATEEQRGDFVRRFRRLEDAVR